MKKITAIILAAVMALSLAVTAAADEVLFEYTTPFGLELGWVNLLEHGSEEALALYEALGTEGAVFKMTGAGLTEADMAEDGAWFQLCTQDQGGWTEGGAFKTEDVGETYEFTDEGYVITVPADVIHDALADSGVDISNIAFVLNSGNWSKATSVVTISVVVPEGSSAAPAETEAPAENDATADSSTAPETGIAMAVVPAVIALAAAAISKKR